MQHRHTEKQMIIYLSRFMHTKSLDLQIKSVHYRLNNAHKFVKYLAVRQQITPPKRLQNLNLIKLSR